MSFSTQPKAAMRSRSNPCARGWGFLRFLAVPLFAASAFASIMLPNELLAARSLCRDTGITWPGVLDSGGEVDSDDFEELVPAFSTLPCLFCAAENCSSDTHSNIFVFAPSDAVEGGVDWGAGPGRLRCLDAFSIRVEKKFTGPILRNFTASTNSAPLQSITLIDWSRSSDEHVHVADFVDAIWESTRTNMTDLRFEGILGRAMPQHREALSQISTFVLKNRGDGSYWTGATNPGVAMEVFSPRYLPNLRELTLNSISWLEVPLAEFRHTPHMTSFQLTALPRAHGVLPRGICSDIWIFLSKFSIGNIRSPIAVQLSWGACQQLLTLEVVDSDVAGPLPNFDGLKLLTGVILVNVKFDSPVPTFRNCPELTSIVAVNAGLRGPIPESFACESAKLQTISLRNNTISALPRVRHDGVKNCVYDNLTSLDVSENNITSLPAYTYQDADGKRSDQFSKTFPRVEWVSLAGNPIQGDLGDHGWIAFAKDLIRVDVSRARFWGQIPSVPFFNKATHHRSKLFFINMSHNSNATGHPGYIGDRLPYLSLIDIRGCSRMRATSKNIHRSDIIGQKTPQLSCFAVEDIVRDATFQSASLGSERMRSVTILADGTYTNFSACTCKDGFYAAGSPGSCFSCESGAICTGGFMLIPRGGYPELRPGSPATIAVVPCSPSWGDGRSAGHVCNPNGNVAVNVIVDRGRHMIGIRPPAGGDPGISAVAAGSPGEAGVPLCAPGYTGRACGACASGFFRHGSKCYLCADHVSLRFEGDHRASRAAGISLVVMQFVAALSYLIHSIARGDAVTSRAGRYRMFAVAWLVATSIAVSGGLLQIGVFALASSTFLIIAGKFLVDLADSGFFRTLPRADSSSSPSLGEEMCSHRVEGAAMSQPLLEGGEWEGSDPRVRGGGGARDCKSDPAVEQERIRGGRVRGDPGPTQSRAPQSSGLVSELILFLQTLYLVSEFGIEPSSLTLVQKVISLFPTVGPWIDCSVSTPEDAARHAWETPVFALVSVLATGFALACLAAITFRLGSPRHATLPRAVRLLYTATLYVSYFFAAPVFSLCVRGIFALRSNGRWFWAYNVTVPVSSSDYAAVASVSIVCLGLAIGFAEEAVYAARRVSDARGGTPESVLAVAILRRYEGISEYARLDHFVVGKRFLIVVALACPDPTLRLSLLALAFSALPAILVGPLATSLPPLRFVSAEVITNVLHMAAALVTSRGGDSLEYATLLSVAVIAVTASGLLVLRWREASQRQRIPLRK